MYGTLKSHKQLWEQPTESEDGGDCPYHNGTTSQLEYQSGHDGCRVNSGSTGLKANTGNGDALKKTTL